MRLAIGSGVAFDGLEWPLFNGDWSALAARARWWQSHGAEGVVFYDTLPNFYETPIDRLIVLRDLLAEAGLAVPVFNAMRKSLHDTALADADEQMLMRCLSVCAALEIKILDVSICAPLPTGRIATGWGQRPPYRGDDAPPAVFDRVAARLKSVARLCARSNIQLAIELHDDGIHDTAANCLRLLQMIEEPNVGVNPDLGNWYRVPYEQQGTWRSEMQTLAPRTIYWEVKNYQQVVIPSDGRAYSWPTNLDAGDIDFRAAASILSRAGFVGWVCHEGGHGDRVTSNVKYLTYFRWIIDEWLPSIYRAVEGDRT